MQRALDHAALARRSGGRIAGGCLFLAADMLPGRQTLRSAPALASMVASRTASGSGVHWGRAARLHKGLCGKNVPSCRFDGRSQAGAWVVNLRHSRAHELYSRMGPCMPCKCCRLGGHRLSSQNAVTPKSSSDASGMPAKTCMIKSCSRLAAGLRCAGCSSTAGRNNRTPILDPFGSHPISLCSSMAARSSSRLP